MGLLLRLFGAVTLLTFILVSVLHLVNGIGINWGTQSSHRLPSTTVVRMLKENGIQKVKLFDADYDALKALRNSEIEVMLGIPNEMLTTMATTTKAAQEWVSENITTHLNNNVSIRYVEVGNAPNGNFLTTTLLALQNVHSALIKAGHEYQVKVTVSLNIDICESSTNLPSGGDFRADIHDFLLQIGRFLSYNGFPFTINMYPFINLYIDPNFPVEFAFFDRKASPLKDNGIYYYNVFDAIHDTLVWALKKNGFENMPLIIGAIGWPTDGDRNANMEYARRFNQGFVSHIGEGTPMRPGPIDAYLFSLIDEDLKSIESGNFERHWGIFSFDGLPKYSLKLGETKNSGFLVPARDVIYLEQKWCVMKQGVALDDSRIAPSVSYACGLGDCTSLGYKTSCSNLDARGNISYAYNNYYQIFNQDEDACNFAGLAVVTKLDPSSKTCKFPIMIKPYYSGANRRCSYMQNALGSVLGIIFFLWIVVI